DLEGTEFTVLHRFFGIIDGHYPGAPLLEASDGNLYGTTSQGGGPGHGCGNSGCGTIFRLKTDGSEYVFYPLDRDVAYLGVGPLLEAADGSLYSTSLYGGVASAGSVFRFFEGQVSLVLSFSGGADGALPAGGLIQLADGKIYGTTTSGGLGFGIVFRLTVPEE